MVATLFTFIGARVAFTFWVREHLLASSHRLLPLTFGETVGILGTPSGTTIDASTPALPNAWPISATLVDHAHHVLNATQLHEAMVRYCPTIATGLPANPGAGTHKAAAGILGGVFESCIDALSHHLQVLVAYQPANHYWPMQALESGVFLAAACALIGATIWRIGRRAAPKPAIDEPGERPDRAPTPAVSTIIHR